MTRAVIVLACAVLSACGGGGTVLSPVDSLPLRPGRQLLTLSGVALSTDPRITPCAPLGLPPAGTSVDSFVTLSRDGNEWIARSRSAAEGDIEIRIRSIGRTVAGYQVEGNIRGTAIDVGLNSVVRDVRATFTGVILEGMTSSPFSAFVGGRASGAVRFSNSAGEGSGCSVVQWTMQPY